MAAENKDDLLDLIFSAPINLPEVKGSPPKPEAPEVRVVEHKDSDVHDKEDAHSNDGSIAHSEPRKKSTDADIHEHVAIEHEEEDSKDRAQFKVSEPEYAEIVKERRETDEEQHYVMEESYVDEDEHKEEHFHEVEDDHDRSSERGRAHSDTEKEEDHLNQRSMPAAASMRMHAESDDGEHKEEYIEEDVPIRTAYAKSESVSSKDSSDSSDHEHEEREDHLETAENYFAYDQEQMRRATLESEGETPDFKVDAESIARSEHEEPEHNVAKSVTSSSSESDDHMHYAASLDSSAPDRVDEVFDNSNVMMCKREEYPVIEDSETDHRSRRSSQSSYRAISVRRESAASTQHGTFEPERAHSIQGEVNEAPGVRNLKALFEHDKPQKARLPRKESHPPVIDYMNEDSYRRAEKPKEQPRERVPEVKPVTAEVVNEVKTAEAYIPPRAPSTPMDKFQSVRVCKNVRQFVKEWGAGPYTPGDPHPLSPVDNFERVVASQEKKHVLKTGGKPGKVAYVMAQPEPEKEVIAPPAAKPKHDDFQVPDVIFSENYVVEDVKINDLSVSERKKMFEKVKAASRRATQSHVKGPEEKVSGKVKPAVQTEPMVEAVNEKLKALSHDQIEETEETADVLTRLKPVAERRLLFEH